MAELSVARLGGGRRLLLGGLLVAVAIGVLYVAVPAIAGFSETWQRLSRGDPLWLVAGLGLEVLSYLSYVALLRAVFADASPGIGWAASYQVTMAGVVASRLLALGGAGGIAVTAWALRKIGIPARELAARLAALFILLYGVFMAALVIGGVGLRTGLFTGPAPPALTIAPAAFGALMIVTVLAIAAVSDPLAPPRDARADAPADPPTRPARGRLRSWARAVPATISSGVRTGLALLRGRRPGLLGAIGWFAFDIAVLWACLQAFGSSPPIAVIVMSYFVGLLANALPIPGGVGAVEGGMVGALVAFGEPAGPAIVGVLSYRALAFWLPMLPGAIAYLQLLGPGDPSVERADAEPGPRADAGRRART